MTRTSQSAYSQKAVKKAFKTESEKAGLTIREAYQKKEVLEADMKTPREQRTRRNPGRMDGVQWNGKSFVCPDNVAGAYDEDSIILPTVTSGPIDAEWPDSTYDARKHATVTLCLLDIAKPAKVKTESKGKKLECDYEFIRPTRQVIVLDDDTVAESVGDAFEDDWDVIYTEQEVVRKPYSLVLKGNG